jgi:ubiquinone/menaquinone biosynthesis C-methylase UbiE
MIKRHRRATSIALVKRKGSVERFFGQHAEDYSKSQSHARGSDLTALLAALRPKNTDIVLDVATGTGFTALALAKLVRRVIGIDVTREMLEQARQFAQSHGVENVEFEVGDALKLNYDDSSFDLVTTRRATHHFEDVPGFLKEARRALRPAGRLGLVDMSPPEGAEAFSNRIERLRDSSHIEAFTPQKWKSMVSQAGFHLESVRILGEPVSFERWLYPVALGGREEESIRLAWSMAPANVKHLLHAQFQGRLIRGWTKSRIILVATKPLKPKEPRDRSCPGS